jgi:hypothetical protein
MKFIEYTKEVGFTVRGDITKERAHQIVDLLFAEDSNVESARFTPGFLQVMVATNDELLVKAKEMLERIASIVDAKPFEWREAAFRDRPYVRGSATTRSETPPR